jgi:23S rRNA maturation-related 3'-5' exoribonuclease YhaM
VDRDVLIASGLLHDVGKPFEFSPRNLERWRSKPSAVGNPSVRHPVYGVHIALMAGLPEGVVHSVGAHSMLAEGSFVTPSLENIIVQYADIAFWKILEQAGLLADE